MHFAISKENVEKVLNTLGEFPAKHSLNAIDIMRSVFPIAENLVEKIFEKPQQTADLKQEVKSQEEK